MTELGNISLTEDVLTAAESDAAYQPIDSDLTAIAALATTAFGRALLVLADQPALLVAAGAAAAAHAHAGEDITSGTVADARIASTIARDSEVSAAVSAEATARDAAIAAAIANLIASAPGVLDTLDEIAAALGDDPNFAATMTTALAGKQPIDSDLTAIAALSTTSYGRSLLELANAAALRTAAGLVIGTDVQAHDSDLDSIAALSTTAYGRSLLEAANAAGLRTLAGTVIGTDVEAHDADLTTIAGLSPTNDDVLQRKSGAWTNRTLAQLLSDLNLGATYQPLDADLTSIAALATTTYGRSLLTLADQAALQTAAGGAVDPIAAKLGAPTTAYEFASTSLTGLTSFGSPDSEDAHTTFADHLYLKDDDGGLTGRFAAAPSAPFTAIVKVTDSPALANYTQAGLVICEASPGKLILSCLGTEDSDPLYRVQSWTNPTTFSAHLAGKIARLGSYPIYLAVRVNSSTSVDLLGSFNGYLWFTILAATNPGFTIGGVGPCVRGSGVAGAAIFDYLRIWNSALTLVGV